MNKLMKELMLSCDKASALTAKQEVFTLSPSERLQLMMHTTICKGCAAYKKQSKFIDQMLKLHFSSEGMDNIPVLVNANLKQQIIANLPSDENK